MHQLTLLKKVADGSVAEAFLAQEPGSDENVLIELSRPGLSQDTELYGRFLDAARERQKLEHPNLLKRLATGCQNDGRLYVVTEPVGGESLQARLERFGPLAPDEAVKIVAQLCEGVDYLHSRGLVHGNLRPGNVFWAAQGVPKLVDMGLLLFRTTRSLPTPTSVVLVAPEYLSPERVQGHRATRKSDIYGLGVLLYELVSGRPPFTSAKLEDTRRLHLTAPTPWMPPGAEYLAEVLGKCLAKNPASRFGSALELRAALLAVKPAKAATPVRADTVNLRAAELPIVEGRPLGPDILGNYELLELIGEGGMGRVYSARHLKLDRKVAIKVLKPELAQVEQQVQRFFQEARAVNRVNHPHIVEIHDFVEEPSAGRVYCVMEYLPGQSLKALGRQGPVPIARAIGIVRQVAQALAAAHQVGVVHRDIKPDNIHLVSGRGDGDFVKVLDFGIAKLRAETEAPTTSTIAGEVIGTPAYMAPEQALGLPVDERSDLYALGTVLYVLLAGRFPFDGATASQIVANLVTQPPRPLGDVSASAEPIPFALKQVVMRCLDKLPQARFQTMGELDAALVAVSSGAMVVGPEDLIEIEATGAKPATSLASNVPKSAKSSLGLLIAVVAVVLGGAAAAWLQPWASFRAKPTAEEPLAAPVVPQKSLNVSHGPVEQVDPSPEHLDAPQLIKAEPPRPAPKKKPKKRR